MNGLVNKNKFHGISDSVMYIFIIIITVIITSIITENIVYNRLKLSEGVDIISGRCRLKKGYGLLEPGS